MKSAVILCLCLASAAAGIYWTQSGKTTTAPTIPADHTSTLSESDYARGHLREKDAVTRMTPRMTRELKAKGLSFGSPVFIRIFKQTREFELWVLNQTTGKYVHFKTWHIAAMSGNLGPKLARGDFQAPEGFYYARRGNMKPDSKYHLAINVGYPNSYDRAHQRTGSAIMIHGKRASAGCFAMTDPSIEEIYSLCATALAHGQPFFRIHIFPFRMTDERLAKTKNHPHHDFWTNLKEGYDWFEDKKLPPNVKVINKQYLFR